MTNKPVRFYVSSHVYRIQAKDGTRYYDDRTHKQITGRRGRSVEKRAPIERERITYRVRDEEGRLSLKKINVNADYRKRGKKHTGSPDNDDFETETAFEPDRNMELAMENARKHLDSDIEDESHWNVSYIEAIS
jgi:hypothetical protein